MTRYEVRKDSVNSYHGIWDSEAATWHQGDGYPDAVYAAGVPMWKKREDAQSTVDRLVVVPMKELLTEEPLFEESVSTIRILDTGLCYICGTSNYEGDHLAADGFARACPSGITREEADRIRRERGETW